MIEELKEHIPMIVGGNIVLFIIYSIFINITHYRLDGKREECEYKSINDFFPHRVIVCELRRERF